MKRTYRELIDDLVHKIDALYDDVGALRDTAILEEKEVYNRTRGTLGAVASAWRTFRDGLPDDRAEMILDVKE